VITNFQFCVLGDSQWINFFQLSFTPHLFPSSFHICKELVVQTWSIAIWNHLHPTWCHHLLHKGTMFLRGGGGEEQEHFKPCKYGRLYKFMVQFGWFNGCMILLELELRKSCLF
jgi:hypothetical protein